MQKLYCYVDESGQDAGSEFFVVVAVVSDANQDELRSKLIITERETKIGMRKWHKATQGRRIEYLRKVLEKGLGRGELFFGKYKKPLPFFLPTLEVLEQSIKRKAPKRYRAMVYVDGIDYKKAGELTNALRVRGITLNFVKSIRDESEPLIRLADRWAGCVRAANQKREQERMFLEKALQEHYLENISP